ncbi:MAG TPA: hypothetical protein VK665_09600 [Candidatus Elarobacter sp.]|nr:hypothetical protein [Candidatus Elarobacter sp.]
MIEHGRRRDEQRLRRAQEIADCARERQAELSNELRAAVQRARNAPIELAAYRAGRSFTSWSLPDDVC